MALRILLAEDHVLARQGLRVLLEQAGMVVIGEASDGPATLALAHMHQPDVVLLDIAMPQLLDLSTPRINGLEVLQWSKAEHPESKVIIGTVTLETPIARRRRPAAPMPFSSRGPSGLTCCRRSSACAALKYHRRRPKTTPNPVMGAGPATRPRDLSRRALRPTCLLLAKDHVVDRQRFRSLAYRKSPGNI